MEEVKNIINIIYKDFGRSRGCKDSAVVFYNIIKSLPFKVEPKLVEVDEYKYDKNELFKFCMVQTPAHRLKIEIFRKQNDIFFGKGLKEYEDDYIQSKYPAIYNRKKFFPKYYFKPYINTTDSKIKDSNNIVLGYYNREDICPLQTKIYRDFIEETKNRYPEINFKIIEFGFGNDQIDINLLLREADIFLYTIPDHIDVYPNTVLQALYDQCYILFINESEFPDWSQGIYEIEDIFEKWFLYKDDGIEKYLKKINCTKENNFLNLVSLSEKLSGLKLQTKNAIYKKIKKELNIN